jgi:hypothetical protein
MSSQIRLAKVSPDAVGFKKLQKSGFTPFFETFYDGNLFYYKNGDKCNQM